MTDEDRINSELHMAMKASEVLNNEAFKSAFTAIEEALLLGMRQTAFKDSELREKLCARYCLLHDLRGQLASFIETGQMAQEEVKRKTIAQKVKEAFSG